MKRKILILIITIVAMAATQNAYCQTDLYNQYKHLTDVRVICIMDFPITGQVKVDITMLEPKTKEAVYYLAEEFNLGIEKDIIDKILGDKNNTKLRRYNVYKDNVKKRYGPIKSPDDYKNISRLIYNYSTGTLMIFHDIDTEERFTAISNLLMDVLTNPEKFPSINNVNKQ
ncbi:MAG: hypothetical protein J6V54_10130 [Bacteroidales bacterium]|nr:hypothetical protein [Bacteroidales bacterium]